MTAKWHEKKESFKVTDIRNIGQDPFDIIMEIAHSTQEGSGFAIIQRFEPLPLINILTSKGFEHLTEKKDENEFRIFFYKEEENSNKVNHNTIETFNKQKKIPIVIQSATPVVYPILLKMLQSEHLNNRIDVRELKVWEETEKHMGWVTNGKADFTFSAIVAASKLYATNQDIKFLSVDVWDNFTLITRGYKATHFNDIKNHTIHLPLFKNAPPYAITSYLMEKEGVDPKAFTFEFGTPFGRPKELKDMFINGQIDTVLLREPEASFVMAKIKQVEMSTINYGDIWKKHNPKFDHLPNAGLIVKGELFRDHQDIVELFLTEVDRAITWVKSNPMEAALLSHNEMGVSVEEAKLFCERVTFKHRKATEAKKEILEYMSILQEQEVVKLKKDIDNEFFGF